jgi:hypothetical protein
MAFVVKDIKDASQTHQLTHQAPGKRVSVRTFTTRECVRAQNLTSRTERHERFKKVCVSLAQTMYRYEARLRTGLLGEPAKHIRPLSEAKCVPHLVDGRATDLADQRPPGPSKTAPISSQKVSCSPSLRGSSSVKRGVRRAASLSNVPA